jgi:acyl-CoA thioesterase FadM
MWRGAIVYEGRGLRFFLVDRIVAWHPGASAEGVKAFARTTETGALLAVESLAQLSSLLLGDTLWREGREALSLMTMIERMEFRSAVRPGDRLCLSATIAARRPEGAKVEVEATRDAEVVCTGRLGFAFFEAEHPAQREEFQWTRELLLRLSAECLRGDPPRAAEVGP